MMYFILKLESGQLIRFYDSSSSMLLDLQKLSDFLGGTPERDSDGNHSTMEVALRKDLVPNETAVYQWSKSQIVFDTSLSCFRLLLTPEADWSRLSARSQTRYWSWLVRQSIYAAILRGYPVILLHGAALKTNNGVIVLCGQSGMGKSTTASRWKKNGGNVLCDDMMLLEAVDDKIVVHPLPTWSRSIQSLEGENVNFEESYPVNAVIALNRSLTGQEYLKEVDDRLFYSSVYSACCFFMSCFIKQMPKQEQIKLQSAAIKWADRLSSGKHLALFADLQGDLRQTLKDFIHDEGTK